MKFKSAKILLLVLGILVIITAIYTFIQRAPKVEKPFANTEFIRIEVKSKDTLSVLEKVGETWKLVEPIEFPVDTSLFYPFLRKLKDLEIDEIVSKREEKHSDFEVDTKGVELKIHWGNRSKTLIVGKMAGDFIHWYLRFPPASETYLSKGLSKFLIDKRPNDWRDHTIFSFNSQDVTELHLGNKKIVRSDTLWMMDKKIIEDKKVKPILDVLSNLRADGFSTEEFETKFEVKMIFKSSIDSEEPLEEKVLYIGEKKDNNYFVSIQGTPTIFLLSSWKVDRIKNFDIP